MSMPEEHGAAGKRLELIDDRHGGHGPPEDREDMEAMSSFLHACLRRVGTKCLVGMLVRSVSPARELPMSLIHK